MGKQSIDDILEHLLDFVRSCKYHDMNNIKVTIDNKGPSYSVKLRGTNSTTEKYVELELNGISNCECSEAGSRNCAIHQHYEKTEI